MRTLLVILAAIMVAGYAYAVDPTHVRTERPMPVEPIEGMFYVQPPHVNLLSWNASVGFGSEVVDDIPDQFHCLCFTEINFYVCEWWTEMWLDPYGVFIKIYYSECPPELSPNLVYYFPWASLSKTLVYEDGWMFVYHCIASFDDPIHIKHNMSIGFQIDNNWGTYPPYCGITVTNEYDIYGDCEGFMDPTYWGYPRWTPFSYLWGAPLDVAYSLGGGFPSDAQQSTWGEIKALYR